MLKLKLTKQTRNLLQEFFYLHQFKKKFINRKTIYCWLLFFQSTTRVLKQMVAAATAPSVYWRRTTRQHAGAHIWENSKIMLVSVSNTQWWLKKKINYLFIMYRDVKSCGTITRDSFAIDKETGLPYVLSLRIPLIYSVWITNRS
jgi:hypothetical protein